MAALMDDSAPMRLLQAAEKTFSDYSQDLGLFFGIQFLFFFVTPVGIMLWRLLWHWQEGFMTMFKAPIGRKGATRAPASALRFWLFNKTKYGYYMDVVQAAFSAISCIMFITVSYAAFDPEGVQDIEFFFTLYFFGDYMIRLYIAQDSLSFFFSLVSMLDFITVVPAIVTWLMSGLTAFETDVQVIVQCIRVMRVFRIFRVIRVIRVMSVSQGYAFQRQVFVLVMTILSLVFAAAGLFQIFESKPGVEYPFHKAVYYAAITVIGRPGVPFTATITAVFLTILAMSAATIIPTFVAELIRLWYDNTALDKYPGNPETPHVIVCGDTNASRLRVLVNQYFHSSRDPNDLAPVVILAEGKPEGALRALLEQHKHSGNVRYVRGSGRRAADLRRAGANLASTCIVLNYRADKDAAAADTEVLSTIMAMKNVNPKTRVLAQLHRPKKRHQLKLVPGWTDGDKAIAALSLSMTVVGLGTRMPGFATFMTNLIRRGHSMHGVNMDSLKGKAETGWQMFLHGEAAKHVDNRDVDEHGRVRTLTPLEEYSRSIDQQVYELEVTPNLVGRTFGAAGRVAFLRYGVTLLGCTVPVNDELGDLLPGLPRTYRMALFPCDTVLTANMKLYCITGNTDELERFRIETGGGVRGLMQQVVDKMNFMHLGENGGAGATITMPTINIPGFTSVKPGEQYHHNEAAAADLSIPWCWHEVEQMEALAIAAASAAGQIRDMLHIQAFTSTGERTACEACGKGSTLPCNASVLKGAGIVTLGHVDVTDIGLLVDRATGGGGGAGAGARVNFDPFAPASSAGTGVAAASESKDPSSSPSSSGRVGSPVASSPVPMPMPVLPPARRTSLADDGLGGIDDTDDITGATGPLLTTAPTLGTAFKSAADAAEAASTANQNSLAVRLALPSAAVSSEDLTLVMPTGSEGAAATAAVSKHKFKNHVLICGVSDSLGFLLRAVASMSTHERTGTAVGSASTHTEWIEGEQYSLEPEDVVILAQGKPAEAAMNAMYSGSSKLLNRVTFITGSASDPQDLLKAGIMTARCALVLTSSKPTASADGSDNLSDDTEAIMITATIHKLNPFVHVITELLHGVHAPYIRPVGSSLNEAQRAAFAYILEEREAVRQRAKLDEAIKRLQQEAASRGRGGVQALTDGSEGSSPFASSNALLDKLLRQQARLRALHPHKVIVPVMRGPGMAGRNAGGNPSAGFIDARAADHLGGSMGGPDVELDAAFSNLTNSAIVDVLVGVREDFGGAAGAAANDGAAFNVGGAGGGAGSSKGSGATNDLFGAPAFASGRVFSFNTMDAIITEAHFEPFIVGIVKQIVRAARRQRLVMLPLTEAILMARLASAANASDDGLAHFTPEHISKMRDGYIQELAHKLAGISSDKAGASGHDSITRYGELFEALLRGWKLLPLGLYRRVHPAHGLKANPGTVSAVAAAAGLPASGDAFTHNRALVSYVYTNPGPDTLLSDHDMVYVLHCDDGDEAM